MSTTVDALTRSSHHDHRCSTLHFPLTASLADLDPVIAQALDRELARERAGLEMIASENHAPVAVMQAQGSVLTNKYAEGYPGRRYYGGCEVVDVVETLAIERAKELFGAAFANVQPHSGAQANAAAMHALIQPGDTILGLDLAHGGHLTHGMRLNFSGRLYEVAAYHVRDGHVDMDEVQELARRHRPRLIIAGWSAHTRTIDAAAFREIADEVGAFLLVDMSHFAGLVAAGLHPSPVPHAHVVTTTTHKTLGGPRGGLILSNDPSTAKKINSAVFPGQQGGPLEHVIAAKAVALGIASTEEFRDRQRRTLAGARILAERLSAGDCAAAGIVLVSGGTDVHLVLVDLRDCALDGKSAEARLESIGITVNRNAVPDDPRPPMVTSGLRIGTPALATRGFGDHAFREVADVIATTLIASDGAELSSLARRVSELALAHPLYPGLTPLGAAS
ncbi:serine hydroxymethyltransferase [Microbacterium elymi]|uniref:Serine hydroxymethyltransferase n=1 Tax=Microbacterium elymi TaxID=2909587 RepID=A0ABY5NK42_9MICO|nr:serine hydroxymethyltransferase [Microbacterium elymi]UUT35538.1 serine hydroxymethyltransferase [Microbacterium elymi]